MIAGNTEIPNQILEVSKTVQKWCEQNMKPIHHGPFLFKQEGQRERMPGTKLYNKQISQRDNKIEW